MRHTPRRQGPDPREQIDALAAQREACKRGEHDVIEAPIGFVSYVGGRRVEPGTLYCRCCQKVLLPCPECGGVTPVDGCGSLWHEED